MLCFVLFFFFQAEDGIRDYKVTGVQTCALPIVGRGKSEVPVEWLKQEWRKRGLLKNIQISICVCLGPCDLTNVVKVSSSGGDLWLSGTHFLQPRTAIARLGFTFQAQGPRGPRHFW